jgi:hypothetical protein
MTTANKTARGRPRKISGTLVCSTKPEYKFDASVEVVEIIPLTGKIQAVAIHQDIIGQSKLGMDGLLPP